MSEKMDSQGVEIHYIEYSMGTSGSYKRDIAAEFEALYN